MNRYILKINKIEEHLITLQRNISDEIFFSSNNLSDTFALDNAYNDFKTHFEDYKQYIYSLDPKIPDNLFEEDLLSQFDIKVDND